MAILKKCLLAEKHKNCRFRDDLGRCFILNDTFFRQGSCPFYKVKKEDEVYDPNRNYYEERYGKNGKQ